MVTLSWYYLALFYTILTDVVCLSWLYLQKQHALRNINPRYMYSFLSCYILALFLNFGLLPSENYRCMPVHNKQKMGMPWTNVILQINFFIQSILLEVKNSSTSILLKNVFPCLYMCPISMITIIFFIACVRYFSFFKIIIDSP